MKKIAIVAMAGLMVTTILLGALVQPAESATHKPDLIVVDGSVEKYFISDGRGVRAKVRNIGTVDVTAHFKTAFYLDDKSYCIGTDTITSLDAGEWKYVYSDTFSARGFHDIIVDTDYLDDVDESNEGNNENTETLYFWLKNN